MKLKNIFYIDLHNAILIHHMHGFVYLIMTLFCEESKVKLSMYKRIVSRYMAEAAINIIEPITISEP